MNKSKLDPLPFGKFQGQTLADVPLEHLDFLCCWENSKSMQRDCNMNDGQKYLWKCRPEIINEARNYVKDKRRCQECFKPLTAIGTARINGKSHADGSSRKYHKKCWQQLGSDLSSDKSN